MALPNFFCLGTQKAGTTTLHNILCQHPDIFLPPSKEAWFFHMDEKYARGIEWYETEYFHACQDERAVGEITPEYMYFETVAERIYQNLGPGIKLIFILRNPVDRAYSHYLMTCSRARETLSFSDAVKMENSRTALSFQNKIDFSYISRGIYASQIERFLKYFPRENMLFLVFEEDITVGIDTTVKRILSFLDVEDLFLNSNFISNPASAPRIPLLRNMIYQPNAVRNLLRVCLPSKKLRSRVRKIIVSLNQVPLENKSPDKTLKKRLIEKYFIEDIHKLETIIKKDLKLWYEDR